MLKCKVLIVLSILMLKDNIEAKPQELQDAALLAFAQVKDTFDNGGAAKDTKEFEFMGAKFKNEMAIGFGDAMRTKRSNNDSSSSSSSESEEDKRHKRSISMENYSGHIVNSQEKFTRFKRSPETNNSETTTNTIVEANNDYGNEYDYDSYEYDYDGEQPTWSSSSSSEEQEQDKQNEDEKELARTKRSFLSSEELQRLKRSIDNEKFEKELKNMYKQKN